MHIALGSRNPVKVAATERAAGPLSATVEAVSVDSGVAEQPRSREETIAGATNRAENALPGYDLAVGLEGGVETVGETLYLIMWAAATDGTRLELGGGPSVPLPRTIAASVEAGKELGPVMDDVLGEDDVGRNQGAAGALTGGVIDRESALAHAVAGALGPWLTDHF